jgi:hypothetical protein
MNGRRNDWYWREFRVPAGLLNARLEASPASPTRQWIRRIQTRLGAGTTRDPPPHGELCPTLLRTDAATRLRVAARSCRTLVKLVGATGFERGDRLPALKEGPARRPNPAGPLRCRRVLPALRIAPPYACLREQFPHSRAALTRSRGASLDLAQCRRRARF